MTIRERLEQQEYMLLAPNAQKAAETKGRLYPAEENEVRTCYQRDADRIVRDGKKCRDLLLTGPASMVCTGEIFDEAISQ